MGTPALGRAASTGTHRERVCSSAQPPNRSSSTLQPSTRHAHDPKQVSRKKMANDWHKRVQAIQAKVTEAAKDVPPGVLAALSGGADAPIDYFRATAIRDKLAEGGERTLFGGLAGAAGLWDNIVKAYEKQSASGFGVWLWTGGCVCWCSC